MKLGSKFVLWLCPLVTVLVPAYSSPRLMVVGEQHEEIVNKVESVGWAKASYELLKGRVDVYLEKVAEEPDWMTSRLAMNWDTHYTQAITKRARTVGGSGKAPVPTPRFAGARDWKTDYVRQTPIDALKPYNDRDGEISLINIKTGQEEWVDVSITGHAIERTNSEIMQLAADAAFVYWVTGDVRYAEFAAPILWTYMHGFSFVEPPYVSDEGGNLRQIEHLRQNIGSTSYEVIHDGILHSIAVAYDFLRDYIADHSDMDGDVIEQSVKIIVDRIVVGGGRSGNWNLHQAKKIAYGGLVLGPNAKYEDGKGREYFVDIALNADLPHQLGLMHVIRQGYKKESAVWAEAPGYAFSTTANIVEIAALLSNYPNGRKVLEDPVVGQAVLNQIKQTYPSGGSHGMGDTSYTRVHVRAAEMMLSWFMSEGNSEAANPFAAMIQREVDSGEYSRETLTSLVALTRYVSELPESDKNALRQTPTYFAEPIDLAMQQNLSGNGNPEYALGASMFGTKGGHMHTNGLSVELYGAGHVLGVDSGRGSSYWQKEQREYYRTLPSHNTVIPNGNADYRNHGKGMIAMDVLAVEPAFDVDSDQNDYSYVTSGFEYEKPAVSQQRTLALIRIDETTAFFFDVMRSRSIKKSKGEYHDWLYHAMADTADLGSLKLEASSLLTSEAGNMKGYDYFNYETSVATDSDLHARFPLEMGDVKIAMDLWLIGGEGRQIFLVDAPANRAARHYVEEKYWNKNIPALVVRQSGEAWKRPFVAVYERSLQSDVINVKSVEATSSHSWLVKGDDWSVSLELDGAELDVEIERD